ncbi:MAG: endolytic transglycosylase MltG, partial [Solirubrobacteraceae bacterium]|nr:endolytic transglycosylase MltG [Patulibacter sp.]
TGADPDGWWDDLGDEPPAAAWPPPLDPPPAARRPAYDVDQPQSRDARPANGQPGQPLRPAQPQSQQPAARSAQPQPILPADDQPRLRPARPAEGAQPRKIEPDPPAQPMAEAFDLPDHRQVAVHRRRSIAGRSTTRTVVSPPGDADMGGSLAPHRSRRRRIAALVGLLVVLLIGWTQWKLWQPLKGGGTGQIEVKIPKGASAKDVADRLQTAGVVDSASLFNLRALLAGKRADLVAGTYSLKRDMSYGAALTAISGGTPATPDIVSVSIPEGLSIREMAARFARQDLLDNYGATAKKLLASHKAQLHKDYAMPTSTKTLEGFLFPATYQLPATSVTADALIERQLTAFEQNFSSVSMTRARKAGLTAYDVLIIASMVEREARLTRERPLIAAVIWNRLKAGMPIGIDATFRYASGNWTDPITQSELQKDGPYNSRTRTGLPPTPIGNPGMAAIEAAAAPAKVDYLYFVVKPGRCGEHAFSSSAAKFAADSAKYNAARNASGKSPETC